MSPSTMYCLDAAHRGFVGVFAEIRHFRLRLGAHVVRDVHRRTQFFEQFLEAALRPTKRARHFGFRVNDQRELAGEVVDNRDLFREQQQNVGRAERIVELGAGQPRLDVAHRVVAEAADQPAREARQIVAWRHLDALHELGDVIERVAVIAPLDQPVAGEQQRRALVHFDARVGRQADHRIAAEALAALHRFEQVAVGLVGEFQVDG